MGGGDLNLKKSWHPSTLRNIERVWKAEQKHEAEQKKIEQLQRELADERAREEIRQYAEDKGVVKKKGDRLDWMYQGPAGLVDREQYLTGRTIDKTFEVLQQLENKNQTDDSGLTQPGAIFSQSTCNVTVDLANKIREDPLFSIRKQETNQKKQLLNNPVKMKQLRELLVQSLDTESKSKKKKNKKNKKKRERHYDHGSDDSLADKKKKHRKIVEASPPHDKDPSPSQPRIYSDGKQYGLIGVHKKMSPQGKSGPNPHLKREKSPPRDRHKPTSSNHSRKPLDNRHDHSPTGKRNPAEESRKRTVKRKVDPAETERKCLEMMQDAKKWHQQRKKNIKMYKEEEDRKDGKMDGSKDCHNFIRPMLSKAATTGTVEDRIKQKMYNLQRNSAAMDKNFARR